MRKLLLLLCIFSPFWVFATQKPCRVTIGTLGVGNTQWGRYVCSSCGTNTSAKPNPQTKKQSCSHCGKSHTNEPWIFPDVFSSEDVSVRGSDLSRVAQAGANKPCPHCGSDVMAVNISCPTCGFPVNAQNTSHHSRPAPVRIPEPEPVRAYTTPRDIAMGTDTISSRWEQHKKSESSMGKMILIGGVVISAVVGGIYLNRDEKEDFKGQVTGMPWQKKIERQAFTLVKARKRKSDIELHDPRLPRNGVGEVAGAFNLTNCKVEIVENDRREEWCDYDTYEWKTVETKIESGSAPPEGAKSLPWPKIEIVDPATERLVRSESYQLEIQFQSKGKTQVLVRNFENESAFLSWSPTEKITLVSRDKKNLSIFEVKRKNGVEIFKEPQKNEVVQ